MNTLKKIRYKASRTALRLPKAWWQHRGLNDQDVLFASFERSGNTWLRFVLMEILTKDNAGFLNVNQILPEMGTHRESKPVLPNGGRFIKTHEQYRSEYKRAIYLMRDLRDVMLSNWARDKEMGFSAVLRQWQGYGRLCRVIPERESDSLRVMAVPCGFVDELSAGEEWKFAGRTVRRFAQGHREGIDGDARVSSGSRGIGNVCARPWRITPYGRCARRKTRPRSRGRPWERERCCANTASTARMRALCAVVRWADGARS